MRTFDLPPHPSSLIESMRDIGYSLSTALADLIDNCITAGATTIHVFADVGETPLRVGVLDDGAGMSETELFGAMRLGSRSPLEEREHTDLGRFGLGLKTASFSQCRTLTVVTKTGGMTACARWDLDRVAASGGWSVEVPDDVGSIAGTERLGDTGTLVVWEKLYADSSDGASDQHIADFVRQLDEARSHLEQVFHRFLEGKPGQPKVSILLNNRPLAPFDPFHSRHPATIAGPLEHIRVGREHVLVQAYTLPHQSKVTPQRMGALWGIRGISTEFGLLRVSRKTTHHSRDLVRVGATD